MTRAVKLRVAAWLLGGLLGLVVLLIALLHTPPVRRYALNKGVEILGRQGIRFGASDFDFNLLEMKANLRNVQVRSPQAPDLPPLLTADFVEVDLSLTRILQGAWHIQDASIRNPNLHLVIGKDGRDNVPRPPKATSEKETDYLIDKAVIESGSFRIEDRRNGVDAKLPLERLTVDGDPLTRKHQIDLRTREAGQISFGGRTMPLNGVGVSVVLDKRSATVNRMHVGLGSSTLTLTGRVDDFDNPRLDLRADSTLALAPLAGFAGIKQTASGTVHIGVTAAGPLPQMKAAAHIEGENLTLDRLRGVDIKSDLSYDNGASRVRFQSLNVAASAGTIRGTADIALNAQAGTSTANVAVSGLDLLQLSTTFKSPVRIASRADARIAANWPGLNAEQAAGEATINLTATRKEPAKDILPVQGRLNVKTEGNRMVVAIPGVQIMNAGVSGSIVVLNRNTLEGKLRVASDNLASTMSAADAFLGRNLSTIPVSGRAWIVADLKGTVRHPVAGVAVEAPELNVGQLQGAAVRAQATYESRAVVLKDAVMDWKGQTLTASGSAGETLNLTATTQNIKIEAILAALNRTDIPASGSLQLDARITGSRDSPSVNMHVTGADLIAYNEPLGTLDVQARWNNDLLAIEDLRLEKPQPDGAGTLRASGSLNTETKEFTLDGNSDGLQLTQLTLPDGTAVRGRVELNAAVQGTADDPAGSIQLVANNLLLGQRTIGDVTVETAIANGMADVDAAVPAFHLAVDGQIGMKAPWPAAVEVRASSTDLASLPVTNMPVKGTVTAVVKASGEIDNWQQGRATAEIAALDLNYNGQPLRSEGPLIARYESQRLTIDRATLLARDSRIGITGTLPLDAAAGAGEIRLSAKLDLPSLVQYLPEAGGITARGTALIDGTVSGTLKSIDPDITIAVNDGYLLTPQLNPPLSGVNLKAQLRNGALELASATASVGPAELTASGTVPFALLPANLPVELPRRQGPATFTAELRDLELGTLRPLPAKFEGTVSVRLEASATKPDVNSVTGRLTLPTLRLRYGALTLDQQGTSTVSLANGLAAVEQFALSGPGTNLSLSGTAGLTGERLLNLTANGSTDAGVLATFAGDVRAAGKTDFHIAITGPAAEPAAKGYIQLADASVSVREPRIALEGLDVRVDLSGTQAKVAQFKGSLNGGDLSGGGSVDFTGGELRTADLNVKASGVYLDVPEGLKTISDLELKLTGGRNNTLVVGGQVTIQEGGFTDDLNFDRGILATVGADRGIDLTTDRNALLERIRFNLGVRTNNPIIVDNNLAQAEITADLRVLGNPYETGLSGRLEIDEGGVLRLQERRYLVQRGVIFFTSDTRIEPNMDILATTRAAEYDIRLQISGTPGKTETTLTSDPPLPEPDILALLVTGRTIEDLRGQEFEVARNQVLSYLTGRIGSQLGHQIAGATGLSTVRIEPNLIAAETDPSARLTVGQDITRNFKLTYSMDLRNSSDQMYIAEYDISRRFTTRGVRQDDGTFRFDFNHDLRFGGTPESGRGKIVDRRIGHVNIIGEQYFSELQIADKFKVRQGQRYDFFKIRKGVDRVEKLYTKAGLLESRVRVSRKDEGSVVGIDLNLTPGPVIDFVYEGIAVPGKVQERIRQIWHDGVFDAQRAEEAVEALRTWLADENRLRPEIEYRISEPQPGRKRILFDIQPGPVFHDVKLTFAGAKGIEEDRLRKVIKDQKLSDQVYTAPGRVTEVLTAFYHQMGYLDADIAAPRYELDAQKGTGQVVFPVTEGPLYKIGKVAFEGNTVYTDDRLLEQVPLRAGEPYRPVLRQNALDRLRQAYWDIGFNDVETEFALLRSKEKETVDLTFRINEGRQAVVSEIRIEGREHTSENLIRTQIDLKPGEILDFERLSKARRHLYDTGAYSLVDIVRQDAEEIDENRARAEGRMERPMQLVVRVREVQPWQLKYGAFFDTERGPGGILDLSNHNMLGSARVLGLRSRYDRQLREERLYFSQPSLLRFPLRTTVSPYVSYERNPATADSDAFNVDRLGFSIQQEAIFHRTYILNYGYKIERTRTYDPSPDSLFDVPLRIASLTTTLSRDTRDEILDATRGSFFSHATQYSLPRLGSEVQFIKYFGQYFRYFALQKPKVELFTNQVLRPRLVYATAVRVGLATGLRGQEVPLAERFFAGGGNTVRGFEQNSLGPVAGDHIPLGGEAMLVLNNEIRFPLFSIFDGAGFIDVGNVYPKVSDLSFADLRKTGGLGLRVRTPWFLIRFDYGLKLDRRPEESRGRVYFSIGQAF